ncbi:MAG: hypothetical protein EOP29_30305 [Rhodococcus sp. (in: high G+C Gram-positive bacteria)]|nr:MAG: hypothetical protein EOP29_30305 [Rhodococcus sp. (in: high G+C Gram-positive bacteria)]
MRLADGRCSIDLTILRYEYPGHQPREPKDWDANWLIISGRVEDDSRSWSFRDPCLTTWEAAELLTFLNRRTFTPGDQIEFTEPNLALAVAHVTDHAIALEITLRAEAAPPEATHDTRWGDGETLTVIMDLANIHEATSEWAVNLASFPVR